jgi:hypothetical protein
MKRTNEGGFDEYQEQRNFDDGDREPGSGIFPNDRCDPMRAIVQLFRGIFSTMSLKVLPSAQAKRV